MALNVLNLILNLFQGLVKWFFSLEISPGVSFGWILVVVIVMFILIKFFLTEGDKNG